MSNLPPPPDNQQPSHWQQPAPGQWQQQPGQWQQQPGPPGQTPAMPYGPGAVAANPYDQEATPVLVTGILSLVVCGFIGVFAWLKGNDLRDRAQAAGWPEPSTARVGRILGIVGTVIGILQIGFAILWFLLFFGIMGAAATAS